jgi:hypothetical protein
MPATLPTACTTGSLYHIAISELDLAETLARNLHRGATERKVASRLAVINAALDLADAATRRLVGTDLAADAARISARVAALEVALAGAGAGARRAASKSAANLFDSL